MNLPLITNTGSEDERDDGPCLSGRSWLKQLKGLGFSSSVCIPDAEAGVDSMMSVIVATRDPDPSEACAVYFAIVPDSESNVVDPQELQQLIRNDLNASCEIISWNDEVTAEHIVIFTGASTPDLLISGNEERFRSFQTLIGAAGGAVTLTSGAHGDNGVPISAALSGLTRALRSEADTLKFVSIDVQSQSDVGNVASILQRCFVDETNETEFAIRDNKISVCRAIPEDAIGKFLTTGDVEESKPVDQIAGAVKLDFRTPGYLESLRFVPDDLVNGPLGPDDVEITVKAAGVNFRHVLFALGKFSAAEYAERPAGECSGVIKAVGANVQHLFQVGDRVVTSGIFNAFTTAVRCPAVSTRRIPDAMSFVTAAQFPLTYITSWFSLVNMAHIKRGDNVLIHSGTGAVGQAAITMAQYFGANIFVTCGNEEKKAFLVSEFGLPEENIFSSKDFRFVDGILQKTNGKGVDIILNSLSGDYIPESCRCLATFGRFIEIGKNDILGRSKLDMGVFNNSTSFMALDLSRVYELDKETIGELLQKMIDMLSDGSLKRASPLHIRSFSETADAFRYMSTGKHIGKMVLDMDGQAELKVCVHKVPSNIFTNNVEVTIPAFGQRPLHTAGTYVIAGGLGGLGREICRWLSKRDAASTIVVLSRSNSLPKAALPMAAELEKRGTKLVLMTCDVGNEQQVKIMMERCKQTLPPVRGVIQGAMVLRVSDICIPHGAISLTSRRIAILRP